MSFSLSITVPFTTDPCRTPAGFQKPFEKNMHISDLCTSFWTREPQLSWASWPAKGIDKILGERYRSKTMQCRMKSRSKAKKTQNVQDTRAQNKAPLQQATSLWSEGAEHSPFAEGSALQTWVTTWGKDHTCREFFQFADELSPPTTLSLKCLWQCTHVPHGSPVLGETGWSVCFVAAPWRQFRNTRKHLTN